MWRSPGKTQTVGLGLGLGKDWLCIYPCIASVHSAQMIASSFTKPLSLTHLAVVGGVECAFIINEVEAAKVRYVFSFVSV